MTDQQILQTYRHDAHKMRGRSHSAGENRIAGVVVNKDVPYGADSDASALSRPNGKPKATMPDNQTHYRLSLLTGDTHYDPDQFSLPAREAELKRLLSIENDEKMHFNWLTSQLVSGFNESTYYPYTSLKYHTLLVAALVHHYRNDNTIGDLYLCVDYRDTVVAHETIYSGKEFSLRISDSPDGDCAALPDRPYRSWSNVWSRLSCHPLDTDTDRFAMTLDANLRRIKAWSTALQYLEDFQHSDSFGVVGDE